MTLPTITISDVYCKNKDNLKNWWDNLWLHFPCWCFL